MIFISHSSLNNEKAIAVRDWLVEQGWGASRIYLDLQNIHAGERWREALNDIGSNCEAVIACLSDDWLRSPECLREFNQAEATSKPIFPVVVAPITERIPRFITDLQFADISDPALQAEGFESLRRGLLAARIVPDDPSAASDGKSAQARAAARFATNLPKQVSSFVGRESVVAEIETLLQDARLVTLFGAGGLGKTRCAQELGARLLEQFDGGVWFVDLAPLRDPALVASEIATACGVREAPGKSMLDALTAHLERKRTLLLLDNCEHVVAEAAKTAAAVLAASANVKIVATSRELLKVVGEAVYQMPTLAVPERSKHLAPESALTYGAVELFHDRARAANRAFRLTADNTPVVAEICARLDGIPLAIELAAARMRMLSPNQLAKQLDERFRVLTGGDRTALPRQQTMRALIDWSYDLLSAQEQRLFRDISVFAGSFSFQTACVVCANAETSELDVLDVLSSLVDKSLAVAEPSDSDARCRVLESIREYGREKSIAAGEAADVSGRHAAAYAELAERLEREYEELPYELWLEQTASEVENVLAALAWSFGGSGDVLVGQRLAATLRRVLVAFRAAEARRWVATALEAVTPATPQPVIGRLELAEATLASTMSQVRPALAAAQRALAIFEGLRDARGVANAQRWAGRSLMLVGEIDEGAALLERSLATLRGLGFRRAGGILRDLGTARALKTDVAGARVLFAQALASFKESADDYNIAVTAGTLADAEFRCGDARAALVAGLEGLEAARARHLESSVLMWLLCNLAAFSLELGQYDDVRAYAHELLALRLDAPSDIDVAFALQHLAGVATLREPPEPGSLRLAATLLGFVDARLAALGVDREYTEQHLYDKIQAVLRSAPDENAHGEPASANGALNEEAAVALALTI